MKKKINVLLGVCLFTSLFMFGCSKPEATPETPAETTSALTSVIDYAYTEDTKTNLYFESKPDEVFDISEYVANYSSGDLFLTLEGYEKVFGLIKSDPTNEEITLFEQHEKENEFDGSVGNIIKISNDKNTVLFRDGSSLYLADGVIKTFTYPPIMTNEKISLPLFDIVFSLGYDSIGTTVGDNNTLTYIVDDFRSISNELTTNIENETETNIDNLKLDFSKENNDPIDDSKIDELLLETKSSESVEETKESN